MKRLVVLALLAIAPRAYADAKQVYAEGEKLYAAGRYLAAAEKFRAAYDLDPDPVYLFNLAQAYRFGEDCARSAAFYGKFLEKVPDAPNAAKVKGWKDEQDACAQRAAAKLDKPVIVVDPLEAPVPPPVEKRGNARLYAGIATAVVGVAAVGFGAYEFSLVSSVSTDRDSAVAALGCTSAMPCTAAQYSAITTKYDGQARDKQVYGSLGLGLGAIAIGAGRVPDHHARARRRRDRPAPGDDPGERERRDDLRLLGLVTRPAASGCRVSRGRRAGGGLDRQPQAAASAGAAGPAVRSTGSLRLPRQPRPQGRRWDRPAASGCRVSRGRRAGG